MKSDEDNWIYLLKHLPFDRFRYYFPLSFFSCFFFQFTNAFEHNIQNVTVFKIVRSILCNVHWKCSFSEEYRYIVHSIGSNSNGWQQTNKQTAIPLCFDSAHRCLSRFAAYITSNQTFLFLLQNNRYAEWNFAI